MASEEEISDIYEVPRPELIVEPEPVSEPEEEPFMDPEEEPEEAREEDHAISEYAADDVALAEEELEGDQRIPNQVMGAVEAELKTVMLDLIERKQGMGVVEAELKTVILDLMERKGTGAVEAVLKTMMLDLMERNQQCENKLQELENKEQELKNKVQQMKDRNEELKALWEAETATRIRFEGVAAELMIKKRRLDQILDTYRTNM